MPRSRLRRVLAFALILATGTLLTAPPSWSSDGALFSGRVFQSDGVSARPGVVVALYDGRSGDVFRSQPTNDEGAFTFAGVPAGTYTLLTESPEGAFLAGDPIRLREGANRPLSLTLSTTPPDGTFAPAATSGKGPSKLAAWLIAGAIIVTALLVLDEWTDDDEATASPF